MTTYNDTPRLGSAIFGGIFTCSSLAVSSNPRMFPHKKLEGVENGRRPGTSAKWRMFFKNRRMSPVFVYSREIFVSNDKNVSSFCPLETKMSLLIEQFLQYLSLVETKMS